MAPPTGVAVQAAMPLTRYSIYPSLDVLQGIVQEDVHRLPLRPGQMHLPWPRPAHGIADMFTGVHDD